MSFWEVAVAEKRQLRPFCRVATVSPAHKSPIRLTAPALGTDAKAVAVRHSGKKSWRHGFGKAVG